MTTTTASPAPPPEHDHFVLHAMHWEFYEFLLEQIGDRPIRVTFDDGSLEIMSPLPRHERCKSRFARLIELLSLELDIPIQPLGSTTFRRKDRRKGLEPDECYYVQHAADVAGKDELDLRVDPPPDLAIEIDITTRSIPRQPVYAALGMPEIWRFDGRRLAILLLDPDGKYAPAAASLAFPFLPMEKFEQFLFRLAADPQNAVLRDFRDWVKMLHRAP